MTRLTRARLLLLPVLALALALAACGGSSGLSRTGFIARADRVCQDGQSSFQAIQAKPPSSAKEAADQTGRLISVSDGELRQLRALDPPGDLRTGYNAYLDSRAQAIAVLRKGEAAARKNDPQGYASAKQEIAGGQPRRFDLARKIGLKVCSRPQVRATGSAKR